MAKSVGVFVNTTLLYYVVQSHFKRWSNPRINYTSYLRRAVGDNTLYRAFAYGAQVGSESTGFIESLHRAGYETRYVPAKMVNEKLAILQTDRNMALAMDIVRIVEKLDEVVIGSNDSNLIPLVQWLKEKGVYVILYAPRIPRPLVQAANAVIEVEEDILDGSPTNY